MVHSPWFNEQEDVTRLFERCNDAFKKGGVTGLQQLDRHKLWKQIWPQKSYDDAHFRRVSSDLTQLCLRFKAMEWREANPAVEWLELQKVLDKPGLEKHLSGVERQLLRSLDSAPAHSAEHYFQYFELHWNIFNRSYKTIASAQYIENLVPSDHFLEIFYLIQKLKLHVAWMSYRLFRSTDKTLTLPAGFRKQLDDPQYAQLPAIRIYTLVYDLLNDLENEPLYAQLRTELEQNSQHLTLPDLRECYLIAQNYCALRINSGKFGALDYYREMFEINRTMTDRNLLLEDGQLAEGVFKNIVTVGLRANEYAWIEQFVNTYYIYLPENIRDNARSYNLANLYSHLRQYDKALEVLRGVEYTHVTYALGARNILVRVYYEQGEYMALDSLIDSYRIYLRRNKVISKNLKKEYNTFLNLVKKLTTLSVANRKELAEFREKVMATSYNTPKKWLLDKIKELER